MGENKEGDLFLPTPKNYNSNTLGLNPMVREISTISD
jgi:hypothetical protein